jgi:hypothetical protein
MAMTMLIGEPLYGFTDMLKNACYVMLHNPLTESQYMEMSEFEAQLAEAFIDQLLDQQRTEFGRYNVKCELTVFSMSPRYSSVSTRLGELYMDCYCIVVHVDGRERMQDMIPHTIIGSFSDAVLEEIDDFLYPKF